MTLLDQITGWLSIAGALNWGIIGFFNINLLEKYLFMGYTSLIYKIIGLASVYFTYRTFRRFN